MVKEQRQGTPPSQEGEVLARMVRLTWRILGNFLLFIFLILMIVGSPEARVVINIVFWAVVAGLIVLRYIDIRVFQGRTADDNPATLKDWLHYSIGLAAMAGIFWVIAQAIINKTT
jgi:hypothetical protein